MAVYRKNLDWRKGAHQIVCESDCKDLIDIVQKRAQTSHHAQVGILQEIYGLVGRCWRVELCWIPREINGAADWMANQGARSRWKGTQFVDSPDQELEVFVLQDKLGVL
ncbi:uncharacterized protein LOC130736957 [Lotus japonicus]|uniref:uncharacterized protein LOC130736957 n=1 Tax=Lotus japonicus TaxID=34305 RepID=UPI0025885080|nr:uncharacterized protein LOC130736957 [Lotus japonicus]